jgi:hypothetical protein
MDDRFWRAVRRGRVGTTALSVAFWLLIGPPDRGDQPVWIIQGSYESHATCEAYRGGSPNPHWLVCVDAGEHGSSPGSRPPTASLP